MCTLRWLRCFRMIYAKRECMKMDTDWTNCRVFSVHRSKMPNNHFTVCNRIHCCFCCFLCADCCSCCCCNGIPKSTIKNPVQHQRLTMKLQMSRMLAISCKYLQFLVGGDFHGFFFISREALFYDNQWPKHVIQNLAYTIANWMNLHQKFKIKRNER